MPKDYGRVPHPVHENPIDCLVAAMWSVAFYMLILSHILPHIPTHAQVCAQVLSGGGDMDPEVLAINAVSSALMCSDIPWAGPVG